MNYLGVFKTTVALAIVRPNARQPQFANHKRIVKFIEEQNISTDLKFFTNCLSSSLQTMFMHYHNTNTPIEQHETA